jgi:predicted ATP-dependent serine protease
MPAKAGFANNIKVLAADTPIKAPFDAKGLSPRGRTHPAPLAEVYLVTMANVAPKAIAWLWPGRLARGKLTLIAGEPGLGKSQLGLDVIARITRRRPWPDEGSDNAPLGSCIILSAEDAIDDVLRPRLEAADADLNRVHAVKGAVFSLQRDLDQLGEKIAAIGDVSLIVIDPITAYFGDQVDTHKTAAVRSVLAQVDAFATPTTSPC